MPQLRVALAQVNLTVGAIAENADTIVRWARYGVDRGAHLIAFPEMALTGYPVEDLALRSSFVDGSRAELDRLASRLGAEELGDATIVIGYLDRAADATGRRGEPKGAPQNAAAVIHRGQVVTRSAKHHLPNYGVFDEFRHFVPGNTLPVVRVHGVDVAIAICEDLWQDGGPVAATRASGAGLLLALNASPYERAKTDARYDLCRRRARQAGCPLAYVNLVGGQDELVFDGDSIVVDERGEVVSRAPQFQEGLLVADLDLARGAPGAHEYDGIQVERTPLAETPVPAYAPLKPGVAPRLAAEEEVYQAVVTGLRDYVHKNGFRSVVLGLSGGIDSALAAAVACDALGAQNVYAVSNPSAYSSDHSRGDADELASRTGLNYLTVPIAPLVEAFQEQLPLSGTAEENLQARLRGVIWMGIANQEGHLVIATGNKSELSVGYSTMYGDAVGAFAPLKDVPKTLVWELARWRNRIAEERGQQPPIPEHSITKPPSAELRPGQVDTDSLPPYDVLDAILDDYVERDASSAEIVASGYDPELVERVIRMVDGAEYKRRQYPPGPKITFRAFGRDRRLPITNGWHRPTTDQAPPDSGDGPPKPTEAPEQPEPTEAPQPPEADKADAAQPPAPATEDTSPVSSASSMTSASQEDGPSGQLPGQASWPGAGPSAESRVPAGKPVPKVNGHAPGRSGGSGS